MRERYRRTTVFLDDDWVTPAWADPARRPLEAPPGPADVAADKCAEHSVDRVAKAIGLAWATTDKLRRGEWTLVSITTCFWANRDKLALMDRQADAKYAAEDAAELEQQAKADATRDATRDARSSRP